MKKEFVINNLRSDKALLFASNYNVLKDQLSMIGAELNECTISYEDENEEKVLAFLDALLGVKLNNQLSLL